MALNNENKPSIYEQLTYLGENFRYSSGNFSEMVLFMLENRHLIDGDDINRIINTNRHSREGEYIYSILDKFLIEYSVDDIGRYDEGETLNSKVFKFNRVLNLFKSLEYDFFAIPEYRKKEIDNIESEISSIVDLDEKTSRRSYLNPLGSNKSDMSAYGFNYADYSMMDILLEKNEKLAKVIIHSLATNFEPVNTKTDDYKSRYDAEAKKVIHSILSKGILLSYQLFMDEPKFFERYNLNNYILDYNYLTIKDVYRDELDKTRDEYILATQKYFYQSNTNISFNDYFIQQSLKYVGYNDEIGDYVSKNINQYIDQNHPNIDFRKEYFISGDNFNKLLRYREMSVSAEHMESLITKHLDKIKSSLGRDNIDLDPIFESQISDKIKEIEYSRVKFYEDILINCSDFIYALQLLESRMDVDFLGSDLNANNFLHYVIKYEIGTSENSAELFIKYYNSSKVLQGLDIKRPDINGLTPIMHVKNFNMFEFLIDKTPDSLYKVTNGIGLLPRFYGEMTYADFEKVLNKYYNPTKMQKTKPMLQSLSEIDSNMPMIVKNLTDVLGLMIVNGDLDGFNQVYKIVKKLPGFDINATYDNKSLLSCAIANHASYDRLKIAKELLEHPDIKLNNISARGLDTYMEYILNYSSIRNAKKTYQRHKDLHVELGDKILKATDITKMYDGKTYVDRMIEIVVHGSASGTFLDNELNGRVKNDRYADCSNKDINKILDTYVLAHQKESGVPLSLDNASDELLWKIFFDANGQTFIDRIFDNVGLVLNPAKEGYVDSEYEYRNIYTMVANLKFDKNNMMSRVFELMPNDNKKRFLANLVSSSWLDAVGKQTGSYYSSELVRKKYMDVVGGVADRVEINNNDYKTMFESVDTTTNKFFSDNNSPEGLAKFEKLVLNLIGKIKIDAKPTDAIKAIKQRVKI